MNALRRVALPKYESFTILLRRYPDGDSVDWRGITPPWIVSGALFNANAISLVQSQRQQCWYLARPHPMQIGDTIAIRFDSFDAALAAMELGVEP